MNACLNSYLGWVTLASVCFFQRIMWTVNDCHVLNTKVGYSVVLQILNRNYGDLEYAGVGTTARPHRLGMGQSWGPHWMVNTCEYDSWLVVWNSFSIGIYWECHHPNWRTEIFFRGVETTRWDRLWNLWYPRSWNSWILTHPIPISQRKHVIHT